MRRTAMTTVLAMMVASVAGAEPAKKPAEKKEPAAAPATAPAAAPATAPAAAPATAPAAAPATAPAAAPVFKPNPKLDLTPSRILDPMRPLATGKKAEESRGMTLGDDTDWRVQAVQVGAMVGVFGALTAICAGGACREAFGDILPGFLGSREEGPTNVIDGGNAPLRQAR